MEPESLRAGDTWAWTRPAGTRLASDGWTLTYFFKNAHAAFSVVASAAGADYSVSVSAVTSRTYRPGLYTWAAVLTKGAEVYTEDLGAMRVEPSFADESVMDTRSDARRRLDAVNAVLDDTASFEQLEVTIGSRTLKKMPRGELLQWQVRLQAQVNEEERRRRAAAGEASGRDVGIRFTRAI